MRLKNIHILGGKIKEPTPIIQDVQYNPKGQLGYIKYFKDASTTMQYNEDTLQLEYISSFYVPEGVGVATPLQDLTMHFDGFTQIKKIEDAITDSNFGHINRTGTFTYDWRGQLKFANRFGENLHYDYHDNGSFTRNDEYSKGENLQSSSDLTALIPATSSQNKYSFNAFGEVLSNKKSQNITYDVNGRISRIELVNGATVLFGYSASGDRVYKSVKSSGTETKSFYPLKSYALEPNSEQSYLFIGKSRLVRYEHINDKWFYYLKDHLTSSDYVMNENGIPVEQMVYLPFGNEINTVLKSEKWKKHKEKNANILPKEKTHHRFTGHYLDDETGFYYMNARYYSPELGRFLSPDPLFMAQPDQCIQSPIECSLYNYSRNNPFSYIDSTGLVSVNAGLSYEATAVGGLEKEYGVVFTYDNTSPNKPFTSRFSVGFYETISLRFSINRSLSVSANIGFATETKKTADFAGLATTSSVSAEYKGVSYEGALSVPDAGGVAGSFSAGVGPGLFKAEATMKRSHTITKDLITGEVGGKDVSLYPKTPEFVKQDVQNYFEQDERFKPCMIPEKKYNGPSFRASPKIRDH